MDELLQANIFFFITSVAVIVFSVLLCIALYYIIKILKAVRSIAERVESGSEVIAEDVMRARNYILGGKIFSDVIGLFMGRGFKKSRARKTKRTESDTTDTES